MTKVRDYADEIRVPQSLSKGGVTLGGPDQVGGELFK